MDFLKLNIKHLRTLEGKTQAQMAEILGVSRDNVASYERGVSPPVEVIHKIVNHFTISFNDLVEKDLSTFESKNVEGVIVNLGRKVSKNESSSMTASDNDREYRLRNIESLERVINAQELTIRTQQETIDALNLVIDQSGIRSKRG